MKQGLKISLLALLAVNSYCVSFAQTTPEATLPPEDMQAAANDAATADTIPVVDGFYGYNAYEHAKPIPFPKVNMNNVKFYKRLWRDIDIADTLNTNLREAKVSLIEVLIEGLNNGKVIAYDPSSTKNNPTGDAFVNRFTAAQAMQRLTDSVLVPKFDDEGNQIGAEMKMNDFNPENVTKFRVKEDVFYDKQRSRVETRIVGIAPLVKVNAGGEVVSEQPAFWLYFPQARYVLVTKESADPQLTFDDIFVQHAFASTIVKESNATTSQVPDASVVEKQLKEFNKNTWKY